MSRRDKQLRRPSQLESEFRTTVRSHLERVAQGYDTFFFGAERFGPFPSGYLRAQQRPIESILSLGDEILELSAQLSEPPPAAVLALHRACQEANDSSNEHRLGPIRLAQRVLDEIEDPVA